MNKQSRVCTSAKRLNCVYRVLYEQTVTRVYLSEAPQLCVPGTLSQVSRAARTRVVGIYGVTPPP